MFLDGKGFSSFSSLWSRQIQVVKYWEKVPSETLNRSATLWTYKPTLGIHLNLSVKNTFKHKNEMSNNLKQL